MSTLFSYFTKLGSKRPSSGENLDVSSGNDCGETTPKSSKAKVAVQFVVCSCLPCVALLMFAEKKANNRFR